MLTLPPDQGGNLVRRLIPSGPIMPRFDLAHMIQPVIVIDRPNHSRIIRSLIDLSAASGNWGILITVPAGHRYRILRVMRSITVGTGSFLSYYNSRFGSTEWVWNRLWPGQSASTAAFSVTAHDLGDPLILEPGDVLQFGTTGNVGDNAVECKAEYLDESLS